MFEIIKGTLSIGNKIRKNETFLIPGLMQIGRAIGMRTRDQALQELVDADLITRETAAGIADKPERFGGAATPSAASSAAGGGPPS
jgi:Tfp pilus assembly pilus retraction ATPase PilT